MIDASAIHLWTWDARPYPVFPAALDVWSDGVNWQTGHWLNGRFGAAPLDALIAGILTDAGIGDFDSTALREGVDGYVIDRPIYHAACGDRAGRARGYAFDAAEVAATLLFRQRGGEAGRRARRGCAGAARQPRASHAGARAGNRAAARSVDLVHRFRHRLSPRCRQLAPSRGRCRACQPRRAGGGDPDDAAAERRANIWLQDLWAGRESADFALPPSRLGLASGDVVGLTMSGRRHVIEIRALTDAQARTVKAQSIDPGVFDMPLAVPRRLVPQAPPPVGPVQALLLDLPTPHRGRSAHLAAARRCLRSRGRDRSRSGVRSDGLYLRADRACARAGDCGRDARRSSRRAHQSLGLGKPRARAGLWRRARGGAGGTKVLNGANAAAVQRPDGALGGAAVHQRRTGRRPHLSTVESFCAGGRWAASGRCLRRCRRAHLSSCSTSVWCRSRAASTWSDAPCSFASSLPIAAMTIRLRSC